jgi:hypothetical protein
MDAGAPIPPGAVDAAAMQAFVNQAIAQALAQQAAAPGPPIDYVQLGNALQAALTPIPPVNSFSYFPGGGSNTPWNFGTSDGEKIYRRATAPIDPIYDGAAKGLSLFLRAIGLRGKGLGWATSIFSIPDSSATNRDLLTEHGLLTLANVTARAVTYVGQSTRADQSASLLATLIPSSITPELYLKLAYRANEYTVNNQEDGPSMLKVLIGLVVIESRSKESLIRDRLHSLPALMKKHKSNVLTFNTEVTELMTELRTYSANPSIDLLHLLFNAYLGVSESSFVDFIVDTKRRWSNNDLSLVNLDADRLMMMAEIEEKTMKDTGRWGTVGKELREAREAIIAMKTVLVAQAAAVKQGTFPKRNLEPDNNTGGTDPSKRSSFRKNVGDYAWKGVAPKAGESKEKTFRSKDYIYCPNHGETKWVLKEKHVGGCKNGSKSTGGGQTITSLTSRLEAGKDDPDELSYAKALINAMHGMDDDDDVEDEEG